MLFVISDGALDCLGYLENIKIFDFFLRISMVNPKIYFQYNNLTIYLLISSFGVGFQFGRTKFRLSKGGRGES